MTRPRAPGDRVVLGREDIERSLDAEDRAIRARRALSDARRSTITAPRESPPAVALQRCATCLQWPRFDQRAGQRVCVADGGHGHPYAPQSAIGMALVR